MTTKFYGEGKNAIQAPRLRPMPRVGFYITLGSLHAVMAALCIVLMIIFGLGLVFGAALNAAIAYHDYRAYKRILPERASVREQNYWIIDDFFTDHDILEIVPPSEFLREREAQWAADYEVFMARQGKAVDGSPLGANDLDSKMSAKVAKAVLEGLRTRITRAHSMPILVEPTPTPTTYRCQNPCGDCQKGDGPCQREPDQSGWSKPIQVVRGHDYHCDDPVTYCTCSDNAPNCRCNVCENRSLDPWDERF